MSGRTRPSARKKTLCNVMHSNLSITDKRCIEEVFEKFGQRVDVVRCKDCRLNLDATYCSGQDLVCCSYFMTEMHPDDYCSHGERKGA